jgi:hypothetical protein
VQSKVDNVAEICAALVAAEIPGGKLCVVHNSVLIFAELAVMFQSINTLQ